MNGQLSAILAAVDRPVLLVVALAAVCVGALLAFFRSLSRRPDDLVERLRAPGRLRPVAATRQPSGNGLVAGPAAENADARIDTRLAQMVIHAGLRKPGAVKALVTAKIVLAVLLPAGFLFVSLSMSPDPSRRVLPWAIALGIIGMLAPNFWLSQKVASRQKAISAGLPNALDLLVTCVEAGLGLDAALARVATEISMASPILAEELRLTCLEVGAGIARTDAFRRLADRTGVEDLRSLAATLTQSERFGTSISAALRMRADWMRTRRMQVAEEKAATVAVKMTVPLVFCVLPALLVIILGPAVVRISETLMQNLGN